MRKTALFSARSFRLLAQTSFVACALALTACSSTGVNDLDATAKAEKKTKKRALKQQKRHGIGPALAPSESELLAKRGDTPEAIAQRAAAIAELKLLKEQVKKRSGRIRADLREARTELERRKAIEEGRIPPSEAAKAKPLDRDDQLDELAKLKAELERRKASRENRSERIETALATYKLPYKYIDQCLKRSTGDFRGLFANEPTLTEISRERSAQLYEDKDETMLVVASQGSCDISFSSEDRSGFVAGLTHILESQGGIVQRSATAGLIILTTVHPRGNFRLATGEKVIGRGGDTNIYTTVSALQ
ncbi:MAG: hypothetical protein AAGJ85_08605 [Pseudomonadota bacterium]